MYPGWMKTDIILWDSVMSRSLSLSQFFGPRSSLALPPPPPPPVSLSLSLSLSLSVNLGLTCLHYSSLNNPKVSLFLWHIFVLFRLPTIYIVDLHHHPSTPHSSPAEAILAVEHCGMFSKISVVHVCRQRSGYCALWWIMNCLHFTSSVWWNRPQVVLTKWSSSWFECYCPAGCQCQDSVISTGERRRQWSLQLEGGVACTDQCYVCNRVPAEDNKNVSSVREQKGKRGGRKREWGGGGEGRKGGGATNRQSVPHMQCAYGNYLVHSCMVCIR